MNLKSICKAKKIKHLGSESKPFKKQSLFEELGLREVGDDL
jgi:hypothetical protein